MSEPVEHRLLVIAGLSPQVISGALYALMVQKGKAVDSVVVITSPEGAHAVRNTFFLGQENPLDHFCRDYGFIRKKIVFSEDDIHVVWPEQGAHDLRESPAWDRLFSLLAGWTHPEAAAIVACMAGGRKDMAVLFSQIFSLLARPEDSLTHLFTTDEFAHLGNFFYPPPQSTPIAVHRLGRGVSFLNSSDARME
ncbi:MAG: TIGR02584 family CRISPR-associated protein, partial [Magnetococcales bacterium]|nr:TIGR02584 family CRISPR-associated protein [Magnetococcales bacterium]